MSSKKLRFLSSVSLFSGKIDSIKVDSQHFNFISLSHFPQPFNFDLPSDSHSCKVKGAGKMTLGKNETLLNYAWGSQRVDKIWP